MLSLILLIVCVLLLFIRYKKGNNFWKKKNILQVDDLIWTFMFNKQSMAEICKTIYDKYNTPYIGTSMGSTPTLILKNIEDIQAVLVGEFKSFHSRGIQTNPSDVLADNLLFMDDYRKWKLIRQKLSPVFTNMKIKNMFHMFEKCARDLVELVEDNEYVRTKPFNVLYTYTTAMIGAYIFGIDVQSMNSAMDSPFLEMSWKSLKPSLKMKIQVFIANAFPKLFKFLNLKVFGEHEKFFVGIVKSVLNNRRCNLTIKHDFMNICLQLQYHGVMQDFDTAYELYPTDEILAAQAYALFIAGADTTANALHFTLLELANNQDILKKVHDEIDSIFGTYKEVLFYDDIEKLQYLDMVISESMRKYPPIGFTQRLCTKDTILPGKLIVEKNTAVIIPIFAIHRDSKYYPDPDVFDPERFNKNSISNTKYKYLPFGEGNRNCIGAKFARFQVKIALAWLLRRFTLVEQNYTPAFQKSPFALRDPDACYELILRDLFID